MSEIGKTKIINKIEFRALTKGGTHIIWDDDGSGGIVQFLFDADGPDDEQHIWIELKEFDSLIERMKLVQQHIKEQK